MVFGNSVKIELTMSISATPETSDYLGSVLGDNVNGFYCANPTKYKYIYYNCWNRNLIADGTIKYDNVGAFVNYYYSKIIDFYTDFKDLCQKRYANINVEIGKMQNKIVEDTTKDPNSKKLLKKYFTKN